MASIGQNVSYGTVKLQVNAIGLTPCARGQFKGLPSATLALLDYNFYDHVTKRIFPERSINLEVGKVTTKGAMKVKRSAVRKYQAFRFDLICNRKTKRVCSSSILAIYSLSYSFIFAARFF